MKFKLVISLFLLVSASGVSAEDLIDLRSALAAQSGQPNINIPYGKYLLDFTSSGLPVSFSGLHGTVIDFNGSTIVCNKQMQAMNITNCENVVIKNFFLEYDPPTCTQGTITAINGSTWDVTLHENYPTENIQLTRTQVYDSETRELIRNFTTIWEGRQSLKWTGDHTLQLSGLSNSAVKAGDYVVLTVLPDQYSAHAIYIGNCTNCKLENITVYDSNCFSFFESDCERTHYYRCKVTRKLNDPKYPQDRLRAGYADALHSKHAKVGPIIEECILEHSGDDCIAINGSFYPVYKVDQDKKTVFILTSESMASKIKPKKNDNLMAVNNNGTTRGKNVITSISTSYPTSSERSACFNKLSTIRDQDKYTHGAKIVLAEWIDGLAVGDMVYSNDRIGSGFKVLNNKVGHNRSRAILIKASDGEITGNTIEHSAMSAIAIAPEFYWLEAGCSQNLEIADNHISDCMYDASMTGSSQAAALAVVAEAPNGKLAPCGTFTNISVHNNDLTDCPYPTILLNAINGGYFYDNTIDPAPSFTRRHGINFGIPSTRPYYVLNCDITYNAPDASIDMTSADNAVIRIIDGNLSITGTDTNQIVDLSIMSPTGILIGKWSLTSGQQIQLPAVTRGIYIATTAYNGHISSQKIIL